MRKDPEGGALSSFLESANPKQRRAQSCRGEADLKKEPQGWERTGQGEDAPGHPPQADQAAASRQKEAKVKAAEREGREERKKRDSRYPQLSECAGITALLSEGGGSG